MQLSSIPKPHMEIKTASSLTSTSNLSTLKMTPPIHRRPPMRNAAQQPHPLSSPPPITQAKHSSFASSATAAPPPPPPSPLALSKKEAPISSASTPHRRPSLPPVPAR